MSSSTELSLPDDGDVAPSRQQATADLAKQLGISDEEPPFWMQQITKASNVVFNSGLVALLRAWYNPPIAEVPDPGTAGVPDWYAEEWAQKTRGRRLAARVTRDMLAFTAGCYLMDGVEAGMCQLRGGKKDPYNKVMGGVAAGGLIGYSWYPGNPQARATVTVAGAAVGFVTYLVEQSSNDYLFAKQRELEKELLHKSDAELRPDLNQYYLRSMLAAKQKQIVAQRAAALEAVVSQEQQRERTGMPPLTPAEAAKIAEAAATAMAEEQDGAAPGGAGGDGSAGGSGSSRRGVGVPGPRGFASSGLAGGSGAGGRGGGGATGNDRGVLVITEDQDTPAEGAPSGDSEGDG